MKIKVSKRDAALFGFFCLILLYLCDISVFNILKLSRGESEGFVIWPFASFTAGDPSYIGLTLFVFVIVIIVIFASVSSSIFNREKGIGFEFGEKKEKGYSRWLKEKEMKTAYKVFRVGVKDETADRAGVVFINDGKNMWVDDSENHTLVIGVTGSGKTSAVVDPLIYSLCKHGESMVITDPKGEIYKDHAELLKARGYKIIVLNFRNPDLGNAWNPLSLPYQLYKAGNVDKAVELVDDVAANILKGDSAQDPFWEDSASDYFSGCTLALFQDAKEEEVNLNSINFMTTTGEDKFGAGSTYIKEYFTMKGEQSTPYVFASNTINSPGETKGSILSVFRQKIRLFSSREQLSEMLSYSDFNMRDIGKESTAVFITIHDEKTTYHALATIFIKQCYETLIDVAQENGGKLPHRTNFILDEFANMPALKDVTTMVTAARSRQIRFTFIIQNFAQLNEVYGEHDAETIRSNCQNLIYLLTTELSALEEISKLCGEVKSKDDEKTASTPLVTVSDLQKLEMNEVIILRNRLNPFRTKLKQAYTIDWGDRAYGKATFTQRTKKDIQLFDIKEFVKVRKRSKAGELGGGGSALGALGGRGGFAGLDTGSPFGGGSGSAPKIPSYEEWMASRKGNDNKTGGSPFGGGSSPFGGSGLFDDEKESPFGGGKPSSSPFGGSSPFERKPSGGIEDPTISNNFNKPKDRPAFDLDELVKRIDAKIEELEAEEKRKATETHATSKPTITLPDSVLKSNKETLNVKPVDEDIVKISDNGNYQQEKPVIIPAVEDDLDDELDDIMDTTTIKPISVTEAPKEPTNGFKQFEERASIDKFEDNSSIEPIDELDNTDEIKMDFEEPKEEDKIDNLDKGLDDLHIEPMKNLTFDSDESFDDIPMNKPTVMISNPIEMASIPSVAASSPTVHDNKPLRGIVDPTKAYDRLDTQDMRDYKNKISTGLSDVSNLVSLDKDIKGNYITNDEDGNKSQNQIETRIRKPIPGSVVVGHDVNNAKPVNYDDDNYGE